MSKLKKIKEYIVLIEKDYRLLGVFLCWLFAGLLLFDIAMWLWF